MGENRKVTVGDSTSHSVKSLSDGLCGLRQFRLKIVADQSECLLIANRCSNLVIHPIVLRVIVGNQERCPSTSGDAVP